MSLYQKVPLQKRSFFQKLFKQYPEENAVIEVNNLLAASDITSISKKDISEIERRYYFSLSKEFQLNLEEFYAVYLNSCVNKMSLTADHINSLDHLQHILSLD